MLLRNNKIFLCCSEINTFISCCASEQKKYFDLFALLWDDTKRSNCLGRAGFAKARYMKSFSYYKHIFCFNQTATTLLTAPLQATTTQSSVVSLATKESDVHLEPSQSLAMCAVINDTPQSQAGLTMYLQSRPPSDYENINNLINVAPPPLVMFDNPPVAITTAIPNEAQCQSNTKQENCSALACHHFAHVKSILLNTKAEVAEWY